MAGAKVTSLLAATTPSPLWYLARGTGIVAILLLSATVVLGILGSLRFSTPVWPRFVQQGLHRNISLMIVVLIPIHVLTSVLDGFVPLTIVDAFIPFHGAYRPIWVGFGALAFDLLIALVITSLLRQKIGQPSWRFIHWLAYLCWPIAVIHGVGTGSDAANPVIIFIYFICIASVLFSLGWRLYSGWPRAIIMRVAAIIMASIFVIGVVALTVIGPLSPNWAKRAGSKVNAVAAATKSTNSKPSSGTSTLAPNSSTPAPPFSANFNGTVTTSNTNRQGLVTINIVGRLSLSNSPSLKIAITGQPSEQGVAMVSSKVTLGNASGTITNLSGTDIVANLRQPNGPSFQINASLQIGQNSSSATGTVTGSLNSNSGAG